MEEPTYQIINKHWWPLPQVTKAVESFCKEHEFTNILEIGPGTTPFPPSLHFIGYNESVTNYLDVDIDTQPLPFGDKSLDFVFSRHTLEDIQNPDFVMREICRIANSGYIETPSPMVEITKGVDASPMTYQYAGYIHHRYVIWGDIERCEIHFLPKYSAIIDNFVTYHDDSIVNLLNEEPFAWNNYFIWKNQTPSIIMHKVVVNISSDNFVVDYVTLLQEAINTCMRNNAYFKEHYVDKYENLQNQDIGVRTPLTFNIDP